MSVIPPEEYVAFTINGSVRHGNKYIVHSFWYEHVEWTKNIPFIDREKVLNSLIVKKVRELLEHTIFDKDRLVLVLTQKYPPSEILVWDTKNFQWIPIEHDA